VRENISVGYFIAKKLLGIRAFVLFGQQNKKIKKIFGLIIEFGRRQLQQAE